MNASNVVITTRDQRCSLILSHTNKRATALSMPSWKNEVTIVIFFCIFKKSALFRVRNIFNLVDLYKTLADNDHLGFRVERYLNFQRTFGVQGLP